MTFDFQPPASDAAIEWALAYAGAGMRIFPVRADKMPLVKGGKGWAVATTDPDQIRAWWKKWPHAEIAWAIPENIVVVDLDRNHKGGGDGIKEFAEREGCDPETVETPIARTARGGLHLIFDAGSERYKNGPIR